MENFPETFKASIFSKKYYEAREVRQEPLYLRDYTLGQTYNWYNEMYDIEEINQFIEAINWQHNENIALLHQVAKYNKEGRYGCGKPEYLEYTFMTNEDFRKCVEVDKKQIREKIYTVITLTTKRKFKIELGKYITKAVNEIVKELKDLEWKIETQNHWDHIHDDYCVIDIVLKCE